MNFVDVLKARAAHPPKGGVRNGAAHPIAESCRLRSFVAAALLCAGMLTGCAQLGSPSGTPEPGARPSARPAQTAPARPTTPIWASVTADATAVARQRAEQPTTDPRRAPPTTKAPMCVAPGAVRAAAPVLQGNLQLRLQQLLDEGDGLAQEREQWRQEVRLAKTASRNLRMPAPGFGCNNPGLGSGLKSLFRSDPRSDFHDVDCVAEMSPPQGLQRPPTEPQRAHMNDVVRLKRQDAVLAPKEVQHSRALAQWLTAAVDGWTRMEPATLPPALLVGIEAVRNDVIGSCIARQGRADSSVELQMQVQAARLAPVFDAALSHHSGSFAAELAKSGSAMSLASETERLFPSPLLRERAVAQPAIAERMAAESKRVAALDKQATQAMDDRRAKEELWWSENSPAALARKRNRKNMETNAAPSADEILGLLREYVILDRGRGADSFYVREGKDGFKATMTLPLLGTTTLYDGSIRLVSWRCQPRKTVQWCEVAYSEQTRTHSAIMPMPPANTERRHAAEFRWTESGLESAGLKSAIQAAHATWNAKVDADNSRRTDAIMKRQECEDRNTVLGDDRQSRRNISRYCGF